LASKLGIMYLLTHTHTHTHTHTTDKTTHFLSINHILNQFDEGERHTSPLEI